jgi:hypothetical protein
MPAKKIGGRQFLGHALLAGVDNFRPRRRGLNLRDMPLFNRIAENDSH